VCASELFVRAFNSVYSERILNVWNCLLNYVDFKAYKIVYVYS